MKKVSLASLGLLLLALFSATQTLAQGPATGGRLIRFEPDEGFNRILVNKGDTIILTMQDFETLHILKGEKVSAIEVRHTGVMDGASSADRWVMEQIDREGNWRALDDHGCKPPPPADRFDHAQGPFRTPNPETMIEDFYLSNAYCTPGVREIMLVAH